MARDNALYVECHKTKAIGMPLFNSFRNSQRIKSKNGGLGGCHPTPVAHKILETAHSW